MSVSTGQRPRLGAALRSGGSWITKYAFLAAFAALFVYFSVEATSFLSGSNLLNALEGSMILLLIALSLTLVIGSGGIDLSAGTALDFGAWFAIAAMSTYGLPWPVAVLCALAGGALVGSVNAFLIVQLGVTPFLATLGTFFIGRSVQQIGTGGGANISYRDAPDAFRALSGGSTLFVPNDILIVGLVLAGYYLYMQRSKHGRRIEAMGLQDSAARTAGLRTRRYRVGIYIAAGVTCAVAGILLSSGLRIYTPNAGFSYLLDGIAAVFIGASMHPRSRPNVLGTLAGVLFLSMLNNGLDLLGLDFNAKAALRGLVLLVALTLAYLIARQGTRSSAPRVGER